jgi:hypothetical protein
LSATDQQIEIRLFRGAFFIGVIVVTTLNYNGFNSGSNKVKTRLRIFLAESPIFCTSGDRWRRRAIIASGSDRYVRPVAIVASYQWQELRCHFACQINARRREADFYCT